MATITEFIVKDVDKFNDKTSTKANIALCMDVNEGFNETTFSLRHVSAPKVDTVVLDVNVQHLDWYFFRRGEITFNINGVKNIKLKAHEQGTDVATVSHATTGHTTYVFESNYYVISKDVLQQICEAKTLDIQLSGEKGNLEMSGEEFILYCQLFYNQVYDESAYISSVENYWPRLRKSANRNNTKNKIRNAWDIISEISDGCAGMFLLIVTLGVGAIWGCVKLISLIA